MVTRVCSKCGLEKDINEFPLRNQFTRRRQSYCKSCKSIMGANWYSRNKDYQIQNARKHRIEYRQNLREYVLDYLSHHPCETCGEADPIVLEFHHVGDKDISVLIGQGSSLETLKKEIAKCQVLCGNCYKRQTAKERGWFRAG